MTDESTSPAPSSPARSMNSTMCWGLNQNIDNTEQRTRDLVRAMEANTQAMNANTETNQQLQRLLAGLVPRVEKTEEDVADLKITTGILTANQAEVQGNVRVLEANVVT